MKRQIRLDYLPRLFPGDHIHDKAPITREVEDQPSWKGMEAVDAARLKRQRKNAKRARQ